MGKLPDRFHRWDPVIFMTLYVNDKSRMATAVTLRIDKRYVFHY